MNFYILDKQEELITIIDGNDTGDGVVYSAKIDEKLESYELLNITIKADSTEASLIEEEYYIIFKDISGWREYTIYEIEDEDGDNFLTTIKAELSSSELIDEIVETNLAGTSKDPEDILGGILKYTRWSVGNVDKSIYDSSFNVNTSYMGALEAITELAKSHSAEIRFSYQVDGNKVVNRFVDLYKQYGEDKGKRFEVDKDINSIKRVVNTENIKTAIIPFSKEIVESDEETGVERTYQLDISDVEWKVSNGDPVDKPRGQNFIGDPLALHNWGRLNADSSKRHRFIKMEFDLDNPERIASMAWVQLGRYTKPTATYEVQAVDLFAMSDGNSNYSHEETSLGDVVVAIDRYFAKPIQVQTRVVEMERDLLNARENKYVFGSSKPIFSVNTVIEEVVDEVAKDLETALQNMGNVQKNLNSKNRVYRGSATPVGMIKNDIWFRPHPRVSGENQMLVYTGTIWEITADTSELQDAGRLQFGTIDGAEINVINLTADNITGGNLSLANGLQLTNGNRVILGVNNSTGEVELNVSSLKINASPVLTQDDLDEIKLADGKSAYEIALEYGFKGTETEWIDSLKGEDGKHGIAGKKGADGKTPYFHTAWANNSNGTSDFSTTVSANKIFIGTYTDFESEDSSDPAKYNWVRIKGEKGDIGAKGTSVETIVEWYLATSASTGVTMKTSGWTTEIQTITLDKKYLWNYEEVKFSDGSVEDTLPVIIGVHGDKGQDGVDGKHGRSIIKIEERYLATSSEIGVTRSTSGWTADMQATTSDKKYLWNYEIVTWNSAPLTTYVEPIIIGTHGEKGQDGKDGTDGSDGTSVDKITEYYLATSLDAGVKTSTSGWTTTIQTITPTNKYLWNYEKIYFSNGKTQDTPPVIIGAYGETGQDGTDGEKGKDGQTSYLHLAYANEKDNDGVIELKNLNGSMLTNADINTNTGHLIHNTGSYAVNYFLLDVDSKKTYTFVRPKAVGNVYMLTYDSSNKPISMHTLGYAKEFTVNMSNYSRNNDFTRVRFKDSANPNEDRFTSEGYYFGESYDIKDFSTTDSAGREFIGSYTDLNEEGSISADRYSWTKLKGQDGVDGTDGRSITEIQEYYLATNLESGVTRSMSGWTTSIQKTSLDKKYLWNYEKITWSKSPTTTYIEPIIIGTQGIDGTDGNDGKDGSDGRGIESTVIEYAQSTSGTNKPSNWSITLPTVAKGRYLWTKTTITYTDNTTSSSYSTSYNALDGKDGKDGANGSDGRDGLDGQDGVNGLNGVDGENGKTYYTWIKYADSPTSGMSDTPNGKAYIGIAYNKISSTKSTRYADYQWALIKGADGKDGINGVKGSDGKTYFTWIKYAETEYGGNMSNSPEGKRYLGIAHNKGTANESNNPSDYTWSPLYDNVIPGSVNLLKNSGRKITKSSYLVNSYYMTEKMEADQAYTITVKADIPNTQTRLGFYLNGGSINLGNATRLTGTSIYTLTFKGSSSSSTNDFINIYNMPDNSSTATIHWAVLTKGNIGETDWVPATTDIVSPDEVISAINLSAEQIKISGDKIILDGHTEVDGSFKVSGDMIADGTLSADKIMGGSMDAKFFQVTDDEGNVMMSFDSSNKSVRFNVDYMEIVSGNYTSILGKDPKDNTPTYYTWTKFAYDRYGTMYDSIGDRIWIGQAFNKLTNKASTNSNAYQWSPLYRQCYDVNGNKIPNLISRFNSYPDYWAGFDGDGFTGGSIPADWLKR